MTTIFLYNSSYWCEECEVHHDVGCWMEDGKYFATDCDGDVVAEFESLDEMMAELKVVEATPPKQKPVNWHVLLSPDTGGRWVDVVSVKRGGKWNAGWRDEAVLVNDASVPQSVRDTLALMSGTSRMDTQYIKTLEDVLSGLSYLEGGVRHNNTLVISFYVKE